MIKSKKVLRTSVVVLGFAFLLVAMLPIADLLKTMLLIIL